MNRARLYRGDRGLVLVLAALFAIVFAGFVALVVGLGFVRTTKAQTQQVVNAVAMAAVQKWVATRNSTEVISRAQQILNENRIVGLINPSDGLGPISYGGATSQNHGNFIRIGTLYQRNPGITTVNNICAGDYPCFIYSNSLPNNAYQANAVQVQLAVGDNNPVFAPLGAIFGRSNFTFNVTATAVVVERCTALLLDVSTSTFDDTHSAGAQWGFVPAPNPQTVPPAPSRIYVKPAVPSLYAIRSSAIYPSGGSPIDCSNDLIFNTTEEGLYKERLSYCSMRPSRGIPDTYPWDGNFPPAPYSPLPRVPPQPADLELDDERSEHPFSSFHFRDEYMIIPYARWQPTLFDIYSSTDYGVYPRPFKTFMDAYNAALRTLQGQQTPLDRVTMKAFVGRKLDEIPPFLDGSTPEGPLTSNLGYLIQITNYDNLLSDVTPNFASHGWYALVPYGNDPVLNSQFNSASNLVEILDETIEELATQCAPHSKKQIIMATDGMMTCTYQTHDEDGIRYPDGAGPRDCDSQTMQEGFDNYLLAEKQLLHGSFPEPTGWGGVPAVDYPSILERLLQHEIALTVLLSGKYVRPNFLNIEDLNPPEPAPLGPPTPLLDYLSAMALGFGSFGTPPPPGTNYLTGDFFDVAPGCPSTVANCTDEVALEFHRSPGFEFARVNGTLGRLATLSGGLWCPLMPRDPTGTYANGVLMNNRAPGTTQRYSIFEMSKTATAAECASKAVGGVSPYILLTPIKQAGVS